MASYLVLELGLTLWKRTELILTLIRQRLSLHNPSLSPMSAARQVPCILGYTDSRLCNLPPTHSSMPRSQGFPWVDLIVSHHCAFEYHVRLQVECWNKETAKIECLKLEFIVLSQAVQKGWHSNGRAALLHTVIEGLGFLIAGSLTFSWGMAIVPRPAVGLPTWQRESPG
jgi:hypothetical protein